MSKKILGKSLRPHQPREEHPASVPALVARQPVFDLQGRVWGYELLFRDPSLQPGLGGKSSSAATSTVMIDGFELMRPMLRAKQRCLINFTEDFLETGLPAMLPPDVCIIEILENVNPTESVMDGLSHLKKQGYTLALDDYVGQEKLKPFLPLVDIIKVDVLDLDPESIKRLVDTLSVFPGKLLAEKVEDSKMAELCRSFGFVLFQGFFYSKAEVVWGKKLSPTQITKARLLSLTASPDPDMQQVAQTIAADVYLSFKMLKFINSLYFGLQTKVRSIHHAIALMGMLRVKQWLCVTALADMDTAPMSQEIAQLSAFRAKFLELLAGRSSGSTVQSRDFSSKLFITGLFSMLESLLGVPLEEVFESIPLDKDVKEVLSFGAGPLAPWLELMIQYEQGHWTEVKSLARRLGLNDFDLANAYVEAGTWSTALFGSRSTGDGGTAAQRSARTMASAAKFRKTPPGDFH